jgi:putative hydrolase of the HAD superfamily
MTHPRAILFDAGGTLVLQHPGQVGERLGMAIDPAAAFEAHYLTMAEFSELRAGGSSHGWDWWLERYFTRLGHPSPGEAGGVIDRGYLLWTWPIPGAVEAVRAIAGAGVRVAVVSNSDGSVEASLRLAGFDGLFEFVLDSAIVGVGKPDPRIFAAALDRLELEGSDVWCVGDSVFHDVGGAKGAGLGGAWLVDPLGLHSDLGERIESVADLPRLLGTGLGVG